MLIATSHQSGLFDNTASNVYGGLIVAAILALATYFWRRSKKFFDNIELDHKKLVEHDELFRTQAVTAIEAAKDLKTTKDLVQTALEANKKNGRALSILISEVKPNGGKRKTSGDTVARSEEKIDELTKALQDAGVIPKLDSDSDLRNTLSERDESNDRRSTDRPATSR